VKRGEKDACIQIQKNTTFITACCSDWGAALWTHNETLLNICTHRHDGRSGGCYNTVPLNTARLSCGLGLPWRSGEPTQRLPTLQVLGYTGWPH